MKKVFGISFLVFMVFLLLINFLITFNLPIFGYRIYKVSSTSMEPKLKYNDFILIKNKASFKEKDIITFKVDDSYMTSRVVKIEGNKIITQGDAIEFANDEITKDMVVGKMVYKFVVLTFINYYLFKPLLWVAILVVGVVVFYINYRKNYK